jgi:hypothetical protein
MARHNARGPERYKAPSRKLLTAKKCYSWRTKPARRYTKLAPADKAIIKAKHMAHKKEYNEALQEAREVVHQQAVLLHKRFGAHSVQYYFEEILQTSRLNKSQRKEHGWNGYLSREIKRRNGNSFVRTYSIEHELTIIRTPTHRTENESLQTGETDCRRMEGLVTV